MSTLHRYTNRSTGDEHQFATRNPRLDALDVWKHEEVSDPDPAAVAVVQQAISRAEWERAVIEDGARTRGKAAELFAEEAARIARESVVPTPAIPANITPSHHDQGGAVVDGGVMARNHDHPVLDPAALAAQAEADSLAIHAMGDAGAVLTRLRPTPPDKTPHELGVEERERSEWLHSSGGGVLGDRAPGSPNVAARPAQNAPKSEWLEYVVGAGIRIREEAEQLTKAELVAAANEHDQAGVDAQTPTT